ncbi:hypothetical protein CR513_43571, partial [Mucuna pruriens]
GLDSVIPSSTMIVMVDGDGPPPLARTLRIKSTKVLGELLLLGLRHLHDLQLGRVASSDRALTWAVNSLSSPKKLASGPVGRRGAMGSESYRRDDSPDTSDQILLPRIPLHLILTHSQDNSKAPRLPKGTAVKQCNLAYDQARKQRKFQLQELDELRLEAYENSRIYKQKFKEFHDQQILRKEFRVGQRLIAGKLRSRWDGPFVITNVFPYGAVELKDEHTNNTFQVNRHQIKLFHEGPVPTMGDMETILLMEPAQPNDTP